MPIVSYYSVIRLFSFESSSSCDVIDKFITMNDDEIVQALWSSDELSEFDDSDADPDFALVNIA